MPKKSINLSLAAIEKVEKRAAFENRNFSNMLETIINQYTAFHEHTNSKMTKEELEGSLGITIIEEDGRG